MVELDDEKVFYAFDKTLEPVMVVPSGTTVRVRTKDCFGNQIQKPEDELDGIDWIIPIRLRAPSSWRGRFRAARSW